MQDRRGENAVSAVARVSKPLTCGGFCSHMQGFSARSLSEAYLGARIFIGSIRSHARETRGWALAGPGGGADVGHHIRAADRLGLSGRRLGDIIGVSEAQVSRFRAGEAMLAEKTKPFELTAFLYGG